MPDYGVEAAVLSKAMDGKPVKVTWTREGRPAHCYYHTVSVRAPRGCRRWQGQAGGLAASHRGADHHLPFNAAAKNEAGFELGMGVINVPFAIRNVRIENPEATAHTRSAGSIGVEHSHAFAIQSFVAELPRRPAATQDFPPRGDRSGPSDQAADAWRCVEPRRSAGAVPVDTGRLDECGDGRHKPAGAGSCPSATVWASLPTTAS